MRPFGLIVLLTILTQAQQYPPKIEDSSAFVDHGSFQLEYSESHEQAKWVYYRVLGSFKGGVKRTNDFRPDLMIKTGSAGLSDYRKSGFDRGHLAPAAVFKYSREAMSKSFLMSNMSPQRPGFNRGIWKRLEAKVREWAKSNDGLHVVSGPVLKSGVPKIGRNRVSVPEKYYKVLLDNIGPEKKAIGFVLENRKYKGLEFYKFAVSIDSVENLTGIDFFKDLPAPLQTRVESRVDYSLWNPSPNTKFISNPSNNKGYYHGYKANRARKSSNFKTQCLGQTKKGRRCRIKTTDPSGFCHYHKR